MPSKFHIITALLMLLGGLIGLVVHAVDAQDTPTAPDGVIGQGFLIFTIQDKDYRYWQIVSLDLSNSHLHALTDSLSRNDTPRWSPGGTKIAFTSERDGNAQVYTMAANGDNPVRLTRDSADDRFPTWSPDGKQIAFESDRDRSDGIYVADLTGEQKSRLLIENAVQPAWSPSGNEIAFVSFRDNNPEIYIETLGDNTHQITRVTKNSGFANSDEDWNPSWSPDSQSIAFESFRTYSWQIYTFNVGTQETKCVTCSLTEFDGGRSPAWSPDGKQIAFISSTGICVMNVESEETRCMKIENILNWSLSWTASH